MPLPGKSPPHLAPPTPERPGPVPENPAQAECSAPPEIPAPTPAVTSRERVMEVHAAIIETMDENLGMLIKALDAGDRLEPAPNAVRSDNGAGGLKFKAVTPAFEEWTNSIENRLETIGRRIPFVPPDLAATRPDIRKTLARKTKHSPPPATPSPGPPLPSFRSSPPTRFRNDHIPSHHTP